jgi:acyl-CoA synthetase (AMP-forming)/AMP-acid ligase II
MDDDWDVVAKKASGADDRPMTTLEGPPLEAAEGVGALTIGGFINQVSARFAGNEAVVFDDPLRPGTTARWSYAELGRQARAVASSLIAAGCGKGSRVGILMGNRPEAVAAYFGAPMMGAVAVLLSTFAPAAELDYVLRHADIEVLLTQSRMLDRRFVDDVASLCPELTTGPHAARVTLRSPELPFLRRVVAVGLEAVEGRVEPWELFLLHGEGTPADLNVSPADHGQIIYTSGTTDRPKGILHNHRAPALQFWLQARVFDRNERSRLWTALPMFWTAGLNTAMGATLAAGGCWVMQESFAAGEALRLMERERVTEPYCLPHQTAALEEHPDWLTTDLSSLRCVYGKSAFARHPTVKGDTGWNSPVGYGLSETCASFAIHYWNTPRELMRTSMGRLLPGNRLRVVDPDTGERLGPNQDGELTISGPTLMEHYVKQLRDECFDRDGFFHTGDAGYFDEEGYLHWTGRRTEMIKTTGANVSPAEIEVALRACQPVKLARVIGVPDGRLGQVVVLCTVLKDGAAASQTAIQDFLRQRLAAYKVPRHVLFFSDGEVPMTGSDTKVRDAELMRLVQARLAKSRSDL